MRGRPSIRQCYAWGKNTSEGPKNRGWLVNIRGIHYNNMICSAQTAAGFMLRTRIRAAIELLDQLYQYGEAGKIRITELGQESFEEDETVELPEE